MYYSTADLLTDVDITATRWSPPTRLKNEGAENPEATAHAH